MSSEDLAVLAEALVAHRTDKQYMADAAWGIPCESHAAVHAIHRAMIEKPGDLGEHAGWKVGTTNATAWTSFELVEPMRAPLFANTIVKAPATFSRKDDNLTMLEAEYCFSLKAPLSGTWAKPVTAEEAWEAVDEVFLAIEVCGSRFALPDAFAAATPYQKIADAGMNVALLLGPAFSAAEMKAKDLAGAKVELIADGVVGGAGTGADVLGDPINSLCYLANALGRTGDGLPAGTLITTGAAAVMQPTEYKAGDTVVAKFDGIGELALNIAADAKM